MSKLPVHTGVCKGAALPALMMTSQWRSNMTKIPVKVFAVDRENGHDLGYHVAESMIDVSDDSHSLRSRIGYLCVEVIEAVRKQGIDAQTYDINVRIGRDDPDISSDGSFIAKKSGPLGEILGATENVGSCEPDPLILWDRTQKTWHTDVDKVGRYSIRRMGSRMPYALYLNNKRVGHDEFDDVAVAKRAVERRIREAKRINAVTDNTPYQSPVGKGEKGDDGKPKAGSPGPELLRKQLNSFGKR